MYSDYVGKRYDESWVSSCVKNHESQCRTIEFQFKKQRVLN